VIGIAACSSGGEVSGADENAEALSTEEALTPCATSPDVTKSLFVTDPTALGKFTLKSVLDQIVATGSTTGQTSLELYQQLLDTLNTKALGVTNGPHCDDVKSGSADDVNGFPVECPRQEGALAKTNPFTAGSPDSYVPVGIVNRFDLAPANGANCGQYRVVFAKLSGKTTFNDRMFLIFEAVLPNPTPSDGLAACLPVAQFWENLSSDTSAADRATKIESFYFTGLTGFKPVIQAAHYGFGGGTNTGQIRANMFVNKDLGQQWELREFRLSQACVGTACTLTADNTGAQVNPFGGLFAGTTTADKAFQTSFLNQVSPLAAKSAAAITMTTPFADNAGESDEQDSSNDYDVQGSENAAFEAEITAKLKSLNRTDLTATNILDRATTQSCAGCHQVSNGRSLGDGVTWPSSNGFTQITESSQLSPALTGTFLPARANVLVNFINSQIKCSVPDAGPDSGNKDSGTKDSGTSPKDSGGIVETDGGSGGTGGGSAGDASGPPPVTHDAGVANPLEGNGDGELTIGGSAVGAAN
jgi:hypothetical protein